MKANIKRSHVCSLLVMAATTGCADCQRDRQFVIPSFQRASTVADDCKRGFLHHGGREVRILHAVISPALSWRDKPVTTCAPQRGIGPSSAGPRAPACQRASTADQQVVIPSARCEGRSDQAVGVPWWPGRHAEMETLPVVTGETEMPAWLGRYRLIAPLGRGGSGRVFRALDPDGHEVAIKTVAPSTAALAGLRTEILALRRVQHRGVVRVLDDGVAAGRPWFAMELLAGETLADHARRLRATRGAGAWTAEQLHPVLQLVSDLCEPLACLHELGVVHHDLKPENVMLRHGGVPVIVDLGLARRGRTDARPAAEPASTGGTLAYMAPEQFTGELLDARADLYALGCILFELLVGAPPTHGAWVPPSQLVGGIPPELDALVASLLQPRARDRIGHAEDVRDCLATIDRAATEPASAMPRLTARPRPRWLYRPRLSGRRDVLAQLARGVDRLQVGHGSFMVIEGESGIGKSHLASEVARLAARDVVVIAAASEPLDGTVAQPLAPWSAVFEYVVDLTVLEPSSTVALVVLRNLPLLRALHATFARLADPRAAHELRPTPDEVFLALRELVSAIADERPLILLIDDLQWADELTLGTLERMSGDWLRDRRVFLLATCRTDDVAPRIARILEARGTARVPLGPLPAPDVRELVADMLGVSEPPDSVVDWIARRAEGNPFLAAEYLRLVVQELRMERELALPRVRVRTPAPAELDSLRTPGSVRELVMRRIDQLADDALHVAELVAVLGGSIDEAAIAELDHRNRDALFDLHRCQIIEPTSDGGQRLLHDRIRVVISEQLADDRRRTLNHEAAELLTRTPASEPRHASIARHYMLAGIPTKALPCLEKAAEIALSRAAYDAASTHFDDARAIAEGLARDNAPIAPLRLARLSHGSARASYGRGAIPACEERVREALSLIGRELPHRRAGWAALAVREGVARLASSRSSSAESELLAEVAAATSLLPYRYFFAEDLVPLVGTALLSANLAQRGNVAGAAAGPLSLLAAIAGLFRMSRLARRYFDEARLAATATADWREVAQAAALESIYLLSFARGDDAERAVRRALEACERSRDPWLRENVETTYSHVDYFAGRFGAARRRAETVTTSARDRRNAQHEIWGLYLQARSDVPLGQWSSAAPLLEAALDQLAMHPELLSEVACRGMLAQVQWTRGDSAGAESLARWVGERVRRRLPTAYPSLVGYTSAAWVLRAALEAGPSSARWRAAGDLAIALWRFAAVFPAAFPAACLHTAHLLRIMRLALPARTLFAAGAARAHRWAMPYDRVLLLLGAARAGEPGASAAAQQILTTLGCLPQEGT